MGREHDTDPPDLPSHVDPDRLVAGPIPWTGEQAQTIRESIARENARAAKQAAAEDARTAAALTEGAAFALRMAEEAQAYRRGLPCFALYQPGRESASDARAAAVACQAVKGHRDCRFAPVPDTTNKGHETCPRRIETDALAVGRERLTRAKAPTHYADVILSRSPFAFVERARLAEEHLPPFYDTEASQAVEAWMQGRGWLLILGGAKGKGKSVGATMALALSERGGLYVTAEMLVSPTQAALDLVERAKVTPLLVVDEMGMETLGEIGMARLFGVLNARSASKLKTIGTTNLNRRRDPKRDPKLPIEPPQFAERYGELVDDRMREGGVFVGFTGASLRGVTR